MHVISALEGTKACYEFEASLGYRASWRQSGLFIETPQLTKQNGMNHGPDSLLCVLRHLSPTSMHMPHQGEVMVDPAWVNPSLLSHVHSTIKMPSFPRGVVLFPQEWT